MELSTSVIDFWKANPSYWICIDKKIQKEADEKICSDFLSLNPYKQNLIGQIIYLDQFSRHFQRGGKITEEDVTVNREEAVCLVLSNRPSLPKMDEVEIVFALMPFKHIQEYNFIFEFLHTTWLPLKGKSLLEYPLLHKFYMDTYKKAFTLECVRENLIVEHPFLSYDKEICEVHPDEYQEEDWSVDHPLDKGSSAEILSKYLSSNTKAKGKVAVSLSGGVDSMVMLYLLVQQKANPIAIHIVYGNRKESQEEYKFLSHYCYKLNVPLYVYKIQWLKRGEVDRKFYEQMTRDIRFFVYKAINLPVCLGHIQDDVVENIWTNFANGKHLHNLKKMEKEEVQQEVCILRPFLEAEKKDIYQVSKEFGIPYLKNTTPSWSNRGKFREHFHSSTLVQFGEGVDKKVVEVASFYEKQNQMLLKLLYEPIIQSFNKKDMTLDISPAIQADLDASGWSYIFETMCHKELAVSKPSIHSVKNFCERLQSFYKKKERIQVDLNKNLSLTVYSNSYEKEKVYLQFWKNI